MMHTTVESELPDSAAALIALARIAHRDGNHQLEKSAVDKLACDFGIHVEFRCVMSVERELREGETKPCR